MLSQPAVSASVLALVTTVHLGLATLRNHRTASSLPVSPLALVAFAWAVTPWLFPSPIGLGLGLMLQLGWFAACEQLGAPPAPAAVSSNRAPLPRGTANPSGPAPAPPHADRAPAPRGFVQAPVLATVDETPTIKTIRVARPDGFTFEAGQFMPVRVRVAGQELTRCYSISSAPSTKGYLEISVRRQGTVSNALHATARPGSVLSIRQPAGAFMFPATDDRPLLLLGGGVGVTPLMSMLRHSLATTPTRPVTLIYSAHSEDDFAFRDELECLARRHPQFHLQLASAGARTPRVYPGRIDADLVRTTVSSLTQSRVSAVRRR
jgi:ferredoxin-NADP reductase